MKQRLEELEKELMNIYAEVKKELPGLHKISFEVQEYEHLLKPKLTGFYHIGKECEIWKTVSELITLVTEARKRRLKNQILFQRFDHVLL